MHREWNEHPDSWQKIAVSSPDAYNLPTKASRDDKTANRSSVLRAFNFSWCCLSIAVTLHLRYNRQKADTTKYWKIPDTLNQSACSSPKILTLVNKSHVLYKADSTEWRQFVTLYIADDSSAWTSSPYERMIHPRRYAGIYHPLSYTRVTYAWSRSPTPSFVTTRDVKLLKL